MIKAKKSTQINDPRYVEYHEEPVIKNYSAKKTFTPNEIDVLKTAKKTNDVIKK